MLLQSLLKQRDDLESQVQSVSNIGRGMIEDKFFDDETGDEFKRRISNLENVMEDWVIVSEESLQSSR